MAKVLKITKPDKTTHVVPLTNKSFYQAHNNRLPADQKWKLEEIDEEAAGKLSFIDESYVTPVEAVIKVGELEKQMSDKDAEIEALKKKLAELLQPTGYVKVTADEVIALINAAATVEQVQALAANDERKTVNDAAAKKIAALKA